ncbi:MAG: 3-methyl-2-oxobutanoate hydroxymethyltransferase [Cyanobacteria bacterium]|nr:3-methyl-2-oxobutanoate hydroxymethyltransferase [Cyanobacteriota bacterium]
MAVTLQHFRQWKQQQRRITALTAWDFAIAEILDQAQVDLILVGDSLAMTVLGHATTLPVTLEEMIHHTKAARRGIKNAFLVMDLPFLTYQESTQQAMRSAGLALKDGGANAVKLEGGYPEMVTTIAHLVQAGIPVMGHIGLTPQSVNQLGFKQQGKTEDAQTKILNEAIALEQAGVFAIVLEHIPTDLAQTITQKIAIPTIGIGAGPHCDGQILVTSDLLGMGSWSPPFSKAYANLRETMRDAFETYCKEVRSGEFPE